MDKHHFDEQPRLAALRALGLLDTAPEARFDQFTALAAAAFGAPIALIVLVDSQRQYFKSRFGIALDEAPRTHAFCSHTIAGAGSLVVNDALQDHRFSGHALVCGAPYMRFYAGHPLRTADGQAVGTLCIMDTVARPFSPTQLAMLQSLAALAETELNRDSRLRARQQAEAGTRILIGALEQRLDARSLALEQQQEALNREIRQRADVEASLRRSEERVRAMIASSVSAFVATDAAACIVEWNAAAARIFGWSRAEVLGRPWSSIMAGAAVPEQHGGPMVRLAARASNGAALTVDMTVISYSIDGQHYRGAFINDVSAQIAAQDKLRSNELMLRTIAENLPTLIGHVDRNGCFVYLNSRALGFYGSSAEQLLGLPVRSAYSAAEYDRIAAHLRAAASGRRASFESEVEFEGKQYFYHAALVPQLDSQGRPDGYFAMAFDISARRRSELAQRDSEERLRTITDNIPVLISYLDSAMRYQFANAMYKDWLGMPSTEMIGRSVAEVFGDAYHLEQAPSIARAMEGHMSSVEVKVLRKGHERVLNTTYMPHYRDGKVVGVYALANDATAARMHERKLLALANADPLTSLPNRRMYEFHLTKALALSKRQQTRLALMYLDLDDFKRINDSHGHGAGDAVLVEFGKRVSANLRESDLLARLAGDEFTVVLEAVESLANCEVIASKIQQALRPAFFYDGKPLHISASIGIALAEAGATTATLSAQADQALYAAKRDGKNRFAVLGGQGPHAG